MGISQKGAEFLTRSRIAEASRGDVDALFELGVTYSTGRSLPQLVTSSRAAGTPCDTR